MRLFSPAFIAELEGKYADEPSVDRPEIYQIATSELWQTEREEIDEYLTGFVARLSADERRRIRKNLTAKNQTVHTYHELVVGYILNESLGYSIRYEGEYRPSDKSKTPDWTVQQGDIPWFAVEVFTKELSDDLAMEDKQWNRLCNRLREEINLGYGLIIRAYLSSRSPDNDAIEHIVREVATWLETQPPVGAERIITDVSVRVAEAQHSESPLSVTVIPSPTRVSPRPLRNSMRKKLRGYNDLSVPLVLAVVPDSHTLLRRDDLEDALRGTRVMVPVIDDPSVETAPIRLADGLLGCQTERTPDAILWVTGGPGHWEFESISITLDLPTDAFRKAR